MRGSLPVTCLLTLAVGLIACAQDASPKKGDVPKVDGEAKTDQSKDAKGDEKKEDAKKKETPKFGKFGKKGGKPVEDTPPPVPVTEPDLAPAALKELDKFQGEWRCLAMTRGGITLAKTDTDRMRLKNDGRRSTLIFLKEEIVRSLIPNPTAKPQELDLLILSEPERGKVRQAIYSFDGDQLRISAAPTGIGRPIMFESKRGSGTAIEVCEKVK
jgi:uncharacterized protein (TIGR03067 family)